MVKSDSQIKKRLLDIAYRYKLSHLGSFLSSIDIIDDILSNQKPEDIFILSSGHAALAMYVCNEKYFNIDAEKMFVKHGGHPHLDELNHIYCSTGSLGLGITIAVGRAIANPNRQVNVLISDGECAEGSVWEALSLIHTLKLTNITVHVNINGFSAYDVIDVDYLKNKLISFLPGIKLHHTTVEQFPFLIGLNAHYHIMSETDYNTVTKNYAS